jgi:hypothetical protein
VGCPKETLKQKIQRGPEDVAFSLLVHSTSRPDSVRHKYELFTLTKKTPLCAFPKEVTVERVRGNIVICHRRNG